MSEKKRGSNYSKFVLAGTSGMIATCIVQPLDLVKTRMQISGEGGSAKVYTSMFDAIMKITRSEGVFRLYTGLTAGLLRQATYTTTRLGVYTSLFEHFRPSEGVAPSFLTKLGIGLSAGVIGAFVGTPAEICLIRMTADGKLPVAERRNYTNVFNAIYRITKEEGLLNLWRGALPTMGRAAVVNVAQLVSYSQVKQMILEKELMKEGIGLHFAASMASAFITTVMSLPVDIAKTRLQNMRTINGKPEYSGVVDIFKSTIQKEGFFAFWKGFTPYLLRIGPHTIITFIVLEQLNKAYQVYVLGGEASDARSGL